MRTSTRAISEEVVAVVVAEAEAEETSNIEVAMKHVEVTNIEAAMSPEVAEKASLTTRDLAEVTLSTVVVEEAIAESKTGEMRVGL